MRYDNERGKGDHKHIGDREYPVVFTSIENLIASFQNDISLLRR
ncbi:toxin-antitoxin system TumE family protein [Pantoea sp. C2G6]